MSLSTSKRVRQRVIRSAKLCALLLLLGSATAKASGADYRPIPGGEFRSVLPADGKSAPAQIAPFLLRVRPVSNAEYLSFVSAHPEWQRDQVPEVMATANYLSQWHSALDIGMLDPAAPVTQISWYAAAAFCESEQARLPRWGEWEFAAAAGENRSDARDDPPWLAHILAWYSRPGKGAIKKIASTPANYYGINDLHGLVWEWVEDFNGLFITTGSGDSRVQGEQKQLEFCGGAALSLGDRRNYAILMRLALLAAMEGNQSGSNLGFRCARDPSNPRNESHTSTPLKSTNNSNGKTP